jgi:NAD(P)-dependent dehydrogenase (short-subunit alcohol dehydrogenase family)
MKNVFITGGGRRIGRGLALRLAKCGWNIAFSFNKSELMAKKTEDEILTYGVKCIKIKADVRIESDIINSFEQIKNEFGTLNLLINNAGVYPKATLINEIEESLWDFTLDTNLKSQFLNAKHFNKIASRNAKIINIASIGGLEIWKNRIPYNVSKAGVIQLTKALARELAPNIAVNCICPGTIVIENEPAEDSSKINIANIPMGRYGNIDDMFDVVNFLANCSNFITGQIINVDGGYHLSN